MVEKNIPVIFEGEPFIWLRNEDGSGALAYPQHVDESGHIKRMFCFSESFAHVMADGAILSRGAEIGTRNDLVFKE